MALQDVCSTKLNVCKLVVIGQQPDVISLNVLSKLVYLQELWLIECKLKVRYAFLFSLFPFLLISRRIERHLSFLLSFSFPFSGHILFERMHETGKALRLFQRNRTNSKSVEDPTIGRSLFVGKQHRSFNGIKRYFPFLFAVDRY